MEDVGLEFRATKDLDIVLHVEALDEDFVSAFWRFIDQGGYQNRQRSTGKDLFYRFHSPRNQTFPTMIELFSRIPDFVKLAGDAHLTPIPTDEATASLSAILLDDDYYHFTHSGKQEIGGISVLQASHLIPLKARAWLDLIASKQAGIGVDEKNIRKHKNDVLRLYQLLTPTTHISMPPPLKEDMKSFLELIIKQPVDVKHLGLKQTSFEEVLQNLKQIYNISN